MLLGLLVDMQYRSSFHGRRRGSSFGTIATTSVIVLVLIGLFVYGIWWFRFRVKEVPMATTPDSITNVLTASPVSSAIIAASTRTASEAKLHDVTGGSSSATITRETDDGQFYLKLKATFPEIDREKFFYETWIIRQVPYDYISVGDVVTNDEGEWVLEWIGVEKKYDAYTRVIVTLEAKDENPDPSGHVLEGEFE